MRNLISLILLGTTFLFSSCIFSGEKGARVPVSRITVANGNSILTSGQNVQIAVKVKVKEGDLASVRLYVDDSLIYSGKEEQFQVTLKSANLCVGSHVIKSEAKDTQGGEGESYGNFDLLSDVAPELLTYKITKTLPHSTDNFTQGLQIVNGILYEGTGEYGKSGIFRMKFPSLQVITSRKMTKEYFGEGITVLKGKLYQITYKEQRGFVYDASTLAPLDSFTYENKEGWGLTNDGRYLIMSDGTEVLTFLDPATLKPVKRIGVADNMQKVTQINELEYINGSIYANIWTTNTIIKIDPKTGKVLGRIILDDLLASVNNSPKPIDVMNGIAYDPCSGCLLITGKYWPKMFELKLTKL
ncbi:MAG: glutaminyl-peptide cyclotransferase [Bacteroidota bacterium]|nr:glutaminyl-peptide cyclotransferase [Bacteroidota bacterium]